MFGFDPQAEDVMGDLIFVAVVVAFFALTVAYVRACERIVGRETGTGSSMDTDAGRALTPLDVIEGGR